VLDGEMEGLKILCPLCMPIIELVLPPNIFKGLMARMKYELSGYQVVTQVFQATYDCIKFFGSDSSVPSN